MHNFTLADISASLAAACLFPLVALIPGYAAAWLLDLFDFRRRTLLFRATLAVPLSIAIVPILSYLAGRYLSMAAVWTLLAASWVYAAVAALRQRPAAPPTPVANWRLAAIVLAVWTALAIFSLIDLQLGNQLYYSVTAHDYSVRAQFIHAISSGGLPPSNPFYFPGHAQPLRYHYFWLIPCSLVDNLGGSFIGPRHAWIGGVIWCGAGFLALVALFFRLVCYQGAANFRRRCQIGMLLLGVTGLDILPTLLFLILYFKHLVGAVQPTVEWWNEQVDGFTWTALWEAHHLAGLVACLAAFLALWEAPRHSGAARWKYAVIGGIALASAAGASIYITLVFGAFLALWTLVAIVRRWRCEAAVLLVAGATCVVLALPYVVSLGAGSSAPASSGGGLPIAFTVRRFFFVDAFLEAQARDQPWRLALVNIAVLPLNYLMELGFFLAAGLVYWSRRRARREPLTRHELGIALMVATTIFICTFFRSTVIDNNDLGWRGFLLAQFGLLLWAVDVLSDRGRRVSAVLAIMIAFGAAGTVYDVFMLRLYPVLADRGAVPQLDWMAPDRHLGERTFAVRQAYEWLQSAAPAAAIVQFDPHVVRQDTPAFLYANRQFAAPDKSCLAGFGGDASLCPSLLAAANRLFPEHGQTAPPATADCGALGANLLVAKDTDAAWLDRQSWVWRENPLYANARVRVIACRNSPASAEATR